jgi:dTDP-4-dehydrorhamnose reductase
MNIIGTGLSGLVGSRVAELLGVSHSFEDLSLESGVDITKFDEVEKRLTASNAPWVFHFAAFTDVQGAEAEKDKGIESVSWKVNVEATKNIASVCEKLGKHILYLSTDYVFDGRADSYDEQAVGNPQGWYAKTKYEGEKIITSMASLGLVVRIANPYRAKPVGKKDFMHKILDRLKERLPIAAPTDQKMTATYIDDLARGIEKLISTNSSGVYNIPGADSFSPYEGARMIAEVFGVDTNNISETTFEEYFANRAPIPQYGVLTHDKIESLGIQLHTFKEGLVEIKQMEENIL